MPDSWVVMVEAARDGGHGAIDGDAVERLHQALDPGSDGGVLHCSDRYVFQVATTGVGAVEALFDVVSRWTDAVAHLNLPAWKLVRAEVLRPEELERDFESAHREEIAFQPASANPGRQEDDDVGHALLRQAFSDPLTGLLSREAFSHGVEAALSATSGQGAVAVVCLDLDVFEKVNEAFGAWTGDQILIAVAQRLAAMLRPADGLARLGGDEYAIVLTDSTEECARAVAKRMLDIMRLPMTVSGHDFTVTASAGVAVSQPGDDAQAVMGKAEVALTTAKALGGGDAALYGPELPVRVGTGRQFPTAALQDRLAHLLLLQRAAVAGNEADSLSEAAEVVIRQICAHVGCTTGHLWVPVLAASGHATPTLVWDVAHTGDHQASPEAAEELSARPDVALAARVSAACGPVWISDLPHAEEGALSHQRAAAAELASAFAFPVLLGGEIVAVLGFFSRTRMEPTDLFLDVLAGIGTQLGRVMERQRARDALRLSEEKLRASEARLQEAQSVARMGSWHFDVRTGQSWWSDGMYTLYGIRPGQPLDLGSALATVHADDRFRAEAALARLVETAQPTAEEIRIVRPDGQVRWHRSEGSAIRDDDGVVVAIQGTSQDITDAKLAQEVLRERDRQLTEAQRAARVGWWEHDVASGRQTWSDEMCRLWGLEPGRHVSFDEFLACVDSEDREGLLEVMARLGQAEEPVCVDFRATVADGRQRWFRARAHAGRDQEGKPVKHFGTAQDITEHKQAEHDLRRAKELYQRIVETSCEGIVTVDAQHVITFVNPRMAEILGYSVAEMMGLPASAFVDERTHSLLAGHQRRRRQGMSEHYQTQLRAKDGAVVQAMVSASPLLDENGDYAGAVAMVTDDTAVREAEEILRSQSLRIQAEVDQGTPGGKPPAI